MALQDFVRWVVALPAGRLVYSSQLSSGGDLYLRLPNSVIIFLFAHVAAVHPGLDSVDILKLYTDSVGRTEWWGRYHVTLIVMASKLSRQLELSVDGSRCKVYRPGNVILPSDSQTIQPNSEIVLCHPQCLGILMGGANTPLFMHQRLFEGEVRVFSLAGARSRSTVGNGLGKPRASVAGAGRNAARESHLSRPKLPRNALLELNADIGRFLLKHVHEHTKVMLEDEAKGPNYDTDSSSEDEQHFPTLPLPPPRHGYEAHHGADEDLDVTMDLGDGESSDDSFGAGFVARVDRRLRSPKRIPELRNRWRPWTPHPLRPPEEPKTKSNRRRRQETKKVDFLGLGDWSKDDPAKATFAEKEKAALAEKEKEDPKTKKQNAVNSRVGVT